MSLVLGWGILSQSLVRTTSGSPITIILTLEKKEMTRTLVGLRRINASQLALTATFDGRRGRNPVALDTIREATDAATIEVATTIIEDIKEGSNDSA